jgi:hypothetical protein
VVRSLKQSLLFNNYFYIYRLNYSFLFFSLSVKERVMLKLINPNKAHQKGNEFSTYKLLTVCTTAILRFSRSDFCLAFGILSVTNYLHLQHLSYMSCALDVLVE